MTIRVLTYIFILLKVFSLTECSLHGGANYWRVFEESNGTVTMKVTGQINYLRGTRDETYLLNFFCFESPSDPDLQIPQITITSVYLDDNSNDNWWMFQGSTFVNAPVGAWCYTSFRNTCWIVGLYGTPCGMSVPIYFNLERRSGKINSSPIALHPPIARFTDGCPDTLVIPMIDQDGDHVTCRYASNIDEGGDVFEHIYPHFSLSSTTERECRISYNGGGGSVKVAIALIIEDHPSSNLSEVLSYSSLQFVIDVVFTSNYSCSDKPSFVNPTPVHNQIYSLNSGDEWQTTIVVDSRFNVSDFQVVGINGTDWQNTNYIGNDQYEIVLSWTPVESDRGFNYMCYSARDTNGIFTQQRCLQFYVDEIDPCLINNGGCSDLCSSTGGVVTCSCHQTCWELASDGLRCVPQLTSSCSDSRMTIRVDKCAYNGAISLGDYPTGNSSVTPVECQGTEFSEHYEFDFALTECGTVEVSELNEIKHRNVVRIMVGNNDGDSLVSRAGWYLVETICTTERFFNASGIFDPEDTQTVIITDEDGFAEIEITFDFYTDSTFSRAYSPYEYPLVVDINDDVYFGILAESTDTDLELFTTGCVAKPDPDPFNIGTYAMIQEGCFVDATLQRYSSTNTMMNQFSVKAFRFLTGLSGINENTNVVIQCEVVVCASQFSGTRCSYGCEGRKKRSTIIRLPFVNKREINILDDEDDDVITPPRDAANAETDTIPLAPSAGLRIRSGRAQGEDTTTKSYIAPTIRSNAPGTFPKMQWLVLVCLTLYKFLAGTF